MRLQKKEEEEEETPQTHRHTFRCWGGNPIIW